MRGKRAGNKEKKKERGKRAGNESRKEKADESASCLYCVQFVYSLFTLCVVYVCVCLCLSVVVNFFVK
jgi:hypothetical protein